MSRSRFELSTPEPCSQDWEAMSGDLRQRHCASCAKTVVDLAYLTEREIEVLAMRSVAGEKVCCRITRRFDGQLVMKAEPVSRSSHRSSVILSAALAAGLPAAAQTAKMMPVVTAAVGQPLATAESDDSQAVVTGRLLKPDGTPVDSGLIYLADQHFGTRFFVVDSLGRFEVHAAPGSYDVVVQTGASEAEHISAVVLHEGQQSFGDVKTLAGRSDLVAADEYTTMGTMAGTIRWSWHSRFRHPVLYVRSVVSRRG